jgi:hypothetical protein
MLEAYNPILNAIQEINPTAHIAGGAVRDTLLERPIKDIDVFMPDTATDAAAKLLRHEFGYVKVGEWAQYLGFSDPAIARLAKFEKADETMPISLIGLSAKVKGIEDNLSRFDFGICMAAWDGEKVIALPEYYRDIEAKSFTLCRADNYHQFAHSMSRFHKITADRYAGWKLTVLEKFKKLAGEYELRRTHYRDYDSGEWVPRNLSSQQLKPKSR